MLSIWAEVNINIDKPLPSEHPDFEVPRGRDAQLQQSHLPMDAREDDATQARQATGPKLLGVRGARVNQ